jgi:hypothetical protein
MMTILRDNIANSECGTEKLCGRRIEHLSLQWMVSMVSCLARVAGSAASAAVCSCTR